MEHTDPLASLREVFREIPEGDVGAHLGDLSPAEERILEQAVERRRYGPGHAIIWEGQPARTIYLLLSGLIRLSRQRPDGGQATIAFIEPVALFGHVSVLGRRPSVTTAAAWKTSEVLHLPVSLLEGRGRGAAAARLSIRLREAALRGMNRQLRAVNLHLLSMAGNHDIVSGMAADLGSWSLPDPDQP